MWKKNKKQTDLDQIPMKKFDRRQFLEIVGLGGLAGLLSGGLFYAGYHQGRSTKRIIYEPGTVFPPLSNLEQALINRIRNKPAAIQDLINNWITGEKNSLFVDPEKETNYLIDVEQFKGGLCQSDATKESECDIWAPAAHFIRARIGDCDDVLALAHLALEKKGYGLFFHDHVVYVYEENGLLGSISINKSENLEAKFKNNRDLAYKIIGEDKRLIITEKEIIINYYQEVHLPNDDKTLLYDYNIKDKIKWGKRIKFGSEEDQ